MQVNFYATLRQIVGGKTVELPLPAGSTAQDLIDALIARFPALRDQLLDEHGQLYQHVHLFVNGRDAEYLDGGLRAVLSPTDTVNIFPPVGGGGV
jgi:molybdopterin synthase sulfur carrier subunit